jgi:hypothetical protein
VNDPLNMTDQAVNQEVAAMTHIQVPGVASQRAPFLSERENQRAVDLIESAERSAPYCPCGSHMIAVAHGEQVWLECAKQHQAAPKSGIGAVWARLTSLGHTRKVIMDLPSAN